MTSIVSGNVNRSRVILVHRDNHLPVLQTMVDTDTGDWKIENVPFGEPFMIIYLSDTDDCAPVIEGGPIFAESVN